MICPRCKTEVNDDMNFCPQCGMKIDRCPQCGQPVIIGAKYCSHCGANIQQQPTKTSRLDGYYEPLSENKHTDEPEQKEVFQDVPVNKKVNKKVIISVYILVASVLLYLYLSWTIIQSSAKNQQETRKVEAMTIGGQTSFSTHIGNINQNGTVLSDR